MYEAFVGLLLKSLDLPYKWLSDNFISHVMTFGKEFGAVLVFISAIAFLLITVYFVMKQARKLPGRYVLEAVDQEGKRTLIPELRVTFATYQAAASYAEFYTKLYEDRYKFKLIGIKDKISIVRRLH